MAEETEVIETGAEDMEVSPTETTETVEEVQTEEVVAEPKAGVEEPNKIVKGLEATVAAERRRRQEAEEKLAELTKPPEVKTEVAKPSLQDFETDEEFLEALTDWKIEDRERKSIEKSIETQHKSELRKIGESINELHKSGRSVHEDWDKVVNVETLAITEVMRDSMLQLDHGQDVFYHLGKNPDLALSIARMPPLKQAIEIAKLETKLASKPKQTTKAPEPIEPVGGKKAGGKISLNDLATRNPREFIRQRNEGLI